MPAESGAWFVAGVPWAVGILLGHAPLAGLWLGAALAAAVLAREPLLWSLWRRARRLPPLPGEGVAGALALLALILLAVWAGWVRSGPALGAAAAGLAAGLFEAGLRLGNARAWWPEVPAAAVEVFGVTVAAAAPRPHGPGGLLVPAAALGYAAAAAVCAMGLHLERVPRQSRRGTARAGWLLWGWTAGAGLLLVAGGASLGAAPVTAAVVGLGLWHAAAAWRQPRTTAFRRLGWREAAWLVGIGGLLVAVLAPAPHG